MSFKSLQADAIGNSLLYYDAIANPTFCSGESLSITAEGTLNEEVEEGAKVHLQVKYGLITLINQEAQLCDYVKNVELKCPLKKGDMTLSKSVDLPKEIPPASPKLSNNVLSRY